MGSTRNVIAAFEKHVKRVALRCTKVEVHGKHCTVTCPLAEFLGIARAKGVIINHNSVKKSVFVNVEVGKLGYKYSSDEIINKVYNKLVQIEKSVLG